MERPDRFDEGQILVQYGLALCHEEGQDYARSLRLVCWDPCGARFRDGLEIR